MEVLVVDDHDLVVRGITAFLRRRYRTWHVLEAASPEQAITLAEQTQPDLVITDVSFPGLSGLDLCRQLIECYPRIRILVFSGYPAAERAEEFRIAGALGYVEKSAGLAAFYDAVDQIASGKMAFPSGLNKQEPRAPKNQVRPLQTLLSPRELTVAHLLALGLSNKAAADRLRLSCRTIESHRARIMLRVGASSLAELVKLAIRDGLA